MLWLLCKIQNKLVKFGMINCSSNFFYLFSYLRMYILYVYNIIQCQYSIVIFFSCTYNCDPEEPKVRCKVTCSVLVYHRYQTCPLLVVDPRVVSHSKFLPNFPRENVIRLLIYFSTREWFKKCVHAWASVYMYMLCFFFFYFSDATSKR